MQTEPFNSLLSRAAALTRIGDWDAAASLYADLFRTSTAAGDLKGLNEALRGSVSVRCSQGNYDDAEDLAELRREIAERNGLPVEAARATHMIGVIRHLRGELSGAEVFYNRALEGLRDAGDDEQLGGTYQNLGVIANIRGDLRGARILYLESIACAIRAGSAVNAMMVYTNLGLVCADLRDWMEAEVYLDRGIEIAEQLGDVPVGAKLRANRAEPLIHTGQLALARKSLDAAEPLAIQSKDAGTLSDIARFRSMIARKVGDFDTAEQHITRSLQLAQKAGLALEQAEASEEYAYLLVTQTRRKEAVNALRRAQDGFRVLGAERDIERTQKALDSLLSPAELHFTPFGVSV